VICLISSGQGLPRRVTQDESTIDARLLTRARVSNKLARTWQYRRESRRGFDPQHSEREMV